MTKQSDETISALIQKDINYMRTDILEIKDSIKLLGGVYATKAEVKEVSDRAIALEKSSNLWKLLSPSLAGIGGSIITFLVIQYLQNASK